MLEHLKKHKASVIGADSMRKFSVCIPLIKEKDGCKVLFEIRAENIGRQPGDICFPGGRAEPGEAPEETAVREMMEELIVDREQVEVIGLMDYMITNFGEIIYPFAVELKDYENTWSTAEVAETFTVPMQFFLDTEPEVYYARVTSEPEENFPFDRIHGGRSYPWKQGRRPIYFYKYGDREIWGMTAMILKAFSETWKKEV